MSPREQRAALLERRIKDSKSEIRRQRAQLAADAAELTSLRGECIRLGIKLVIQAKGETHGHADRTAS